MSITLESRNEVIRNNNTANIGYEQKLWLAADKLRGNMDAAEYKHVILGLIFLKYISDSFESHRSFLVDSTANPKSPLYVKNKTQRKIIRGLVQV